MNTETRSRFGRALLEALPEIYRTRDAARDADHKDNGEGHLAAYLDSCGMLLDAVYNILDQRYRDCFPETCQEWLLPYFAELLGASMQSPHIEGRRREIMHSVAWRQAKGSLTTVRDIAEKIGCFGKPVVQEGWKRLARTARFDGPFVFPTTVDLREKKSHEDFVGHLDTAPHFVDIRKPDWNRGHANPRAALVYAPPYTGFFTGEKPAMFAWQTGTIKDNLEDINNWFKGVPKGSIKPSDVMELEYKRVKEKDEKGVDTWFDTWFFYKKPGITKPVHITGTKDLGATGRYRFSEINLDDKLISRTGSYLTLEKLAAKEIQITNSNTHTPVTDLFANDCLFGTIKAPNSKVQLEYCTVLGETTTVSGKIITTVLSEMTAEEVEASDCIFVGKLYKNGHKAYQSPGVIRYSRYSRTDVKVEGIPFENIVGNSTDMPVFYTSEWGKPGCGVIHPESPETIRHGAEDGGEMGAFHHRAYVLSWEAVIRKLDEYLPAGMGAALIPSQNL